jgi:hypothetical protein
MFPKARPELLQHISLQAGFSRWPHSRQHLSKRDVMSPQNGHMRCDAKSPTFGCIFTSFLMDAAMQLRSRRRRARNGCRTGSMLKVQEP